MGELNDSQEIVFQTASGYHVFHDVIREAKAIISKPGGCTLIDSLSSCTPVVFLPAYGHAEEKNAKLWEYLGYGISYATWQANDFSHALIKQLHHNLLYRKNTTVNYLQAYAERLLPELEK
jgi:UDP-N-acetylglucosamine:LPS N-acetylglucosamine transferase